jgi:outer membrane biosynthesis protein TonB
MTAAIRRNSLMLSLLFHGVILLILFFALLITQIPPFGGGGGEASNLGYVELASGNEIPTAETVSETPVTPTPQVVQQVKEDPYITQEDEESIALENKKKEIKKEPIKPAVSTPVAVKKPEVKPQPVQPKVNQGALYKGSNKSGSQGTATSGTGDQGTKDGDPNSLYPGKGNGQGGDGSGGGKGDGIGPGTGTGNGPGFSYNLAGRKVFAPPRIFDNSQETGKVVVEIKVDKYGNVLDAIPGARGSTTTSSNLFKKAKEAALKAKFNASPDGTEEQRGTITFVFVMQ